MFDIGFWELLVIAVVLLLVLGPERLPEVAKQAAFFVRKARQGMYRLRNEMKDELGGDPLEGLQEARREMADFKNDIKQMGRDLADSAEIEATNINSDVDESASDEVHMQPLEQPAKKATKKTAKKKAKKAVKKAKPATTKKSQTASTKKSDTAS